MLTYTNSFRCAISENKSEVIITLFQTCPVVSDDGKVTGVDREVVANIAMPGGMATQLRDSLDDILNRKP